MVAAAVLAIVLVILLGALSTSLSLWRNTENKLLADREARGVELLLAQDLSGVLMPSSPELWPRTNQGALQFLTLKPPEYQSQKSGENIGDVCFVEYYFDTNENRLTRRFLASAATYNDILSANPPGFPQPVTSPQPDETNVTRPQTLAANLLEQNKDAVRGNENLFDEMSEEHFVILSTNHPRGDDGNDLLPIEGAYSISNHPVVLEVNFAATDPDTLANKELLGKADYVLRNAGLYSFRVILPPPAAP